MSSGVLGFVLGMSCFGIAMKLSEYKDSPTLPPLLAGIPVSVLTQKCDNQLSSYYVKKLELCCFHSVCMYVHCETNCTVQILLLKIFNFKMFVTTTF